MPERRAVIIVENLPVPFDRRVWQEACALRDSGWTVSVISPQGLEFTREREVIDDIRVFRHPQPPDTPSVRGYLNEYASALRWESKLLRVVAQEVGFDVIHVCNPPDLLFLPSLPWKRRVGAALVFDHHDRTPELYEAKYDRRDMFYTGLRFAERLTFGAADAVIATNETHREIAIARGGKRAEDVFIVRSSPPLPIDASPPPAHRKDNAKWRVGYVGVMGDQDGLDLLLHAAAHIVKSRGRDDVEFVLAGGGSALDDLVRLSNELDLGGWVEFTGFLDRPRLVETLSTFDVGAAPDPKNPYNDGCTMNKVLEYMAMGKPMVQFDLVEGRRSAGDASLYVKNNDPVAFGDALLQLIDDAGLAERLGAEGLRRFRDMTWDRQVPHLLSAYERAIEVREGAGVIRRADRAAESGERA